MMACCLWVGWLLQFPSLVDLAVGFFGNLHWSCRNKMISKHWQAATECPPTTIWYLFPRQWDFARNIKRQQHTWFGASLISEQAAKFNAIGRHTVTLHKHSHLHTEVRVPEDNLVMLNLPALTHMLLRAQQSLHKFHLPLVQHTTSSCNLSQSHTINIRPMLHVGWCITNQHMQQRHLRQPAHYFPRN